MAAKSLMIQGTASNAGKSLLAAGLCRIFAQDGLRVAPFKSQNMALNSYVTADGLEMGRAQVTQAECAGIEPDVRMNPILLKPTSDSGSQVIVGGEVVGNMRAREYYAYKSRLVEPVMEAYRSLAVEHDLVVLEGAGSPAEINLREGDIVNMGMARLAGAPVLLAGDIDRGGVFASLVGTEVLLEPWEKNHLKGFVINKFRGDRAILEPGLRMLEDIAHRPVLGVVPYLQVDIDDEDSLSERLSHRGRGELVDIAVMRLPRLSNFTDFTALSVLEGVGVRYISSPREWGDPDLVILPGTKSTLSDLLWLRQSGLEACVRKHAAAGKPVLGICGGYQMLCRTLRDPDGVEGSPGEELAGIGLLPGDTVFSPGKIRRRVCGRLEPMEGFFAPLSGLEVEGYEIHMGETKGDLLPLARLWDREGEPWGDGAVAGNVCGTYLHGFFDSGPVAAALVRALAAAKGVEPAEWQAEDAMAYKNRQYDLLADALRESLDMKRIYEIVERGV